MKTKRLLPIVVCLFISLFFIQPLHAADRVTIAPSGDATGQTDADALQAALSDAEPGVVIQLEEGIYYLNHVLLAENFRGTIQGAGCEKTIITTVGELPVSPDVPVWKNPPSLQNPWPFVLTIVDGDITLQAMTWRVTERIPMRFKYVGDFEIPALAAIISIESSKDGEAGQSLLQDIGFEGAEGEFSGHNMIQAVYHEGLIGWQEGEDGTWQFPGYPLRGQHRISSAFFKHTYTGSALSNMAPEATLTVEKSTFVEEIEGFDVMDSGGTLIVADNVISTTGSDGVGIIVIQGMWSVPKDIAGSITPPLNLQVTNNQFYIDNGQAALDLEDMQTVILGTPSSLDATVEGNQIVLNKANYGIIGYGLTDFQLRNNTITGSALYDGIHVSFASNDVTTLQPGDKAQLGAYGRDVLRRAPQSPAVAPSIEVTPTMEITPTSTTPAHIEIAMTAGEKRETASPQEFAFYELPEMDQVGVANVAYKDDLTMDLLYPPDFDFAEPLPVVLFVHGVNDYYRSLKDTGWYVSWGQLVAASGMVGVNYDIREPSENIIEVLYYLQANADTLGIDPNRICLYASSGNPPAAILAMTRQAESFHDALCCDLLWFCNEAQR
jgi:hypothetical protein